MWKLLTFLTLNCIIYANVSNKEIANMFIVGFNGNNIYKTDICNSGIGGVIVFKKSPSGKKFKNFYDATSLKRLTSDLKKCTTKPLIAVDQEGGLVQRIKFTYRYPKASSVAKKGLNYAKSIYNTMAQELNSLGINLNFAPVADLALNPKNRVIVYYGRSYGKDYKKVIAYDKTFIEAMHNYNIATTLKHFPGHGSSFGDTHKGFVDVTNQWRDIELKPYYALKDSTDAVMVAHIFNKRLDSKYPASLSKNIVTSLLRDTIGFKGVIITDDLQMGAIKKHYSLKKRIELAINAGNDLLLFANQLSAKDSVTITQLISITKELINEGKIDENLIKRANIRINRLKSRLY